MATKWSGSTPRENKLAEMQQRLAAMEARLLRLRRLARRVTDGLQSQPLGGYWTRDAGAVLALKTEIEHERNS